MSCFPPTSDAFRGLSAVNVKRYELEISRDLQQMTQRMVSEGEAPTLESLQMIFFYSLKLLDNAREANLYKEGPEINPVLTSLSLIFSKLLTLSSSKAERSPSKGS